MTYENQLALITYPSFGAFRQTAKRIVDPMPQQVKDQVYDQLNRGVALLNTDEQMCLYLFAFGNMHQAKLLDAFRRLPQDIFQQSFHVVDWGCGQAMGTVNLFDYVKGLGIPLRVKKVTLIEPSAAALERAVLHTSMYVEETTEIEALSNYFEHVRPEQITAGAGIPVIHIFSNILDVAQIDLKHLAHIIDGSVISDNYLVCVGPLNPNNQRIDAFYAYFDAPLLYAHETYRFKDRSWTYKCKLFKLAYNDASHLLPIEFYPAVQFQAAYELDMVRKARLKSNITLPSQLRYFEVAAPFDLGASVYEDVHPILAVMNNIITRGLPTKTSPYIETQFVKAFQLAERVNKSGEICFEAIQDIKYQECIDYLVNQWGSTAALDDRYNKELQLILTPVAIAKFQKVLLEAIITGHLSLDMESWTVMVEEHDVPFAALAIADFKQLFEHLTRLSEDYQEMSLPEIQLHIQSNTLFKDSPLHLDTRVYTELPKALLAQKFDLVVSMSTFKRVGDGADAFSRFQCNNDCYFNIRAMEAVRSERAVYTSDSIRYRHVVSRNDAGITLEIPETSALLTYFLQLVFRKEAFRPGQLPILDRALQNLPVIGLLPTGGGKSLTYQIAAILQPGVTMVVDPLKSLMRDQLDGLRNCGIDSCALINSTLKKEDREAVEKQLESSQLLFIFLSPERLSIATFRERLRHMHDYNVYFSYGVIDEVHCVSEWGHDFRFSYLHLGRNLYQYVKAKERQISLFGLTATASFDVLADVERELSGNGAFPLDADAIVRHENTDRLELQYKVERVPVAFKEDSFYDRNGHIDHHLPRAVNIADKWSAFESKSQYLQDLVPKIPSHLGQLQTDENIAAIKERFEERQSLEVHDVNSIKSAVPTGFLEASDAYKHAGIVFCPHVETTGLSVTENRERLANTLRAPVGSFSGRDNDDTSMNNLVRFRDNQLPLMVATKAFGMGIDKPNVRFTVNLNFSSSLESFVQEAGRAGRDRKMALATILFSDYTLARVNPKYNLNTFPLGIIKGKWFHQSDLATVLKHYGIDVPTDSIDVVTPSTDIVKLHCSISQKIFGFNKCKDECGYYNTCSLGKVLPETKGWKTESELAEELKDQGLKISRRNYQYLNADYEVVMHFFNESFKGDVIEKQYMNRLMNKEELTVQIPGENTGTVVSGFLSALLRFDPGQNIIVYVPYQESEYADLSKAIYRMCCIELITDFTQDYASKRFRIVANRKEAGGYFDGLLTFLKRYYTGDRAVLEVNKAKQYVVKGDGLAPVHVEIYQCLAYLTDFVYEKISEKRKRAIDDMRDFCLEGLRAGSSWVRQNEELKDFIFYYFNSKYAKAGYVADNGEPFSLVEDTEGGKISDAKVLFKYLRVIDDEVIGAGTPLDNVKHLLGAVRYIKRALTDSNPTIFLLEVFCLVYLGVNKSANIRELVIKQYSEAMLDLRERYKSQKQFWIVFNQFNQVLERYLSKVEIDTLVSETQFLIHAQQLAVLTTKYISGHE